MSVCRARRLAGVVCAMVGLVACTQPPPAGASGPRSAVTASAAPAASPPLFAILTGGTWNDGPARHDTVRILGLDGTVRASATFAPRTLPQVGAVPLLQDEARTAAGRVYYADASGVIRTLSPDGAVAEVARLPAGGAQQTLSFAVSADGSQLAAAVLSLPPPNAGRKTPDDPVWAAGTAAIDLYQVRAGQQPVVLLHRQWTPGRYSVDGPVYQAVGYDQEAIFTEPTQLGTQEGYNGRRWFGPAVRLGPAGAPSAPLGGAACVPMATNGAGVFACLDQHLRNPTLRNADGSLLWAFPNADENVSYFTFSPAGDRLAAFDFGQRGIVHNDVVTLHGDVVGHPAASFRPRAWLDDGTLLGEVEPPSGERQLAYVLLSDPGTVHDLGQPPAFAVVGPLAPKPVA